MDQFFQQLRKIQKKERSNGTLARVDDSFYKDIHKYLDELRTHIGNDPFAAEQYLLKDTQRIATEICERREHKITDAAVVNIHRSYHLFAGKPQFDLIDTTPLNLTPEEEKFYFSLIDTLTNHRKSISLEKLSSEEDIPNETKVPIKETPKPQSTTLDNGVESSQDDAVLNRIDEISKAKVITDEKAEPIEKQIQKSNIKPAKVEDDISELARDNDEFVDLESIKIAKDSELVTMLVFDDVDSIVGVDERVYGPFRPQDLVVLPKRLSTVSFTISIPDLNINSDTTNPIIPSTGRFVYKDDITAIQVAEVAITSVLLSLAVASITEELIFFPRKALKNDIQSFIRIDTNSEINTIRLNVSFSGCIILFTEFLKSSNATISIRTAIVSAVRYSIRPCPNG